MTMKKKLYKAFESVTPDLMDQVMAACPVPAEKTQDGALARRTNQLWYRSALSTAAAVVLFLSVCGVAVWLVAGGRLTPVVGPTDPTVQTEPTQPFETTEPTQTDPPATESRPTEGTETTEPTQTDPPATESLPTEGTEAIEHPWYVENPPTMSYEEFFSKTRVQTGSGGNSWTAPTGTVYELINSNKGLRVRQAHGSSAYYTVPGFEGPDCGVTPAYCNGNIAYVYNDTQLLRVDIITGENEVVAEFDRMMGASGWGPYILRFAAVTGDKLAIYQIYVPTETVELLCSEASAKTAPGWFSFGMQKTTQDPVVWEMVNPKAYTILEQEIRNAGSVLLEDADIAKNFGALWENPEKLDEELRYEGLVSRLLRTIQDKFGVNALVRCIYDPITGEYTEKEGVMDSCWFGSGLGCDHFAPEETAEIIPTVIETKVTPIEGLTPPSPEIADKMREEEWGFDQKKYTVHAELYDFYYLCVKENGSYRRVCDVPMRDYDEVIHTDNGAYLATVDGALLWVDNEENVTQIYQAQFGELKYLAYRKGKLAVVDGDHIVMLDLVECTCSVILYHPGSIWMYFDSDNELYVDITLGLDVRAYLFNFETGVLAQTNYRL